MPFSGGQSPNPERYGSGELGSSINLVQHVYRAFAQARGSAFDQTWPPTSPVGVENLAFARAIALDGFGANTRFGNNFVPTTMTVAGNLGRWEKILGLTVLPTDSEPVRRARVAATLIRFGQGNANQQVADAAFSVLGAAFVQMVYFNPSNATSVVNGISNLVVTPTGGGSYAVVPTLTGTPTGGFQFTLTVQSNGGIGAGTYSYVANGTSFGPFTIQAANLLGTTGVTFNFDASNVIKNTDSFAWSTQPGIPWSSSICTVDVQASYQAAQYKVNDGSPQGAPNASWWALVGQLKTLLDSILPAWDNFGIFVACSTGGMHWLLDEHQLDLEAFGS